MKSKKCKQCKHIFIPKMPLQSVCSPSCAIDKAIADREKKEASKVRIEKREAKEKSKTRGDWMREAQAAFNAFIRARDSNKPCISCGRSHEGQWHAGHYRATSTAPELRFNEDNVHKQCAPCNTYKHGNLIDYRINLINRIGLERVEFLESPHEPKKYSIADLEEIKSEYKRKLKDLICTKI